MSVLKNTFFIILFLLFFPFMMLPLYSQEDAEQNDIEPIFNETVKTITDIEIIGLKRTKPHIARYPLEKFIGQEESDFDENEVFAIIKNMGILEPSSVQLVENEEGFVLQVTVQEKWSLFPFPLVFAGSGERSIGLFLFDANAFGQRDSAILGGAYGSNGWSIIAMYNSMPKRQEAPGWNAIFMYFHQEKEDQDREENILRVYTSNRILSSFGLNYAFTEKLSGSFSLSVLNISLKENEKTLNSPESGAMLIGFNPRLSIRNSSWDGYFLNSKGITFEYSYNLNTFGSSFHEAGYRCNFDQSIVPGFRMNIKSGGSWKSTSDPLFYDGPQKAQVNILPRKYSALYYAGLSAGLEKYLLKGNSGTLSFQGSYQGVFSYPKSTFEFDHGPSGGLVFYLSRIAIPAIGTGLAYNMVSGLFQFSFSMGMSF